ncbi:EGF-like domain-containing protein [Aphelenchoides fujianensis]|nr:EGF-like domain-containing protein [Aphelenchoides fujianensis]
MAGGHLGDVLGNVWKKVKQVMGFSPPCQNQGHKNLRGLCECPKYFEGEWCEKIVCINNGTKTKVKAMVPQPEVCQCPHPAVHHRCSLRVHPLPERRHPARQRVLQMQRRLLPRDNSASSTRPRGLRSLDCRSSPLAVVILCCIVCRLDLCPRRSSRRRQNERRRHYGNYQMPRRTYGQQHRHTNRTTEISPAADRNSLLVYRLESVPAFNPNAYEDFDYKMMEPPPAPPPAPRNPQPRSSARRGEDEGG